MSAAESQQPSSSSPEPNSLKRPAAFVDSDSAEASQKFIDDGALDSGYNSLIATPATDTTTGHDAKRIKNIEQFAGAKRLLWSPSPDLVCFDNPLDGDILKWFEEMGPRIENLLVEFLKSGRRLLSRTLKPIAVRLMLLGESENTATPHLVVFVPSKCFKGVKDKFLAREDVKELLTPRAGSGLVRVIVTAHAGFLTCRISNISALCSSEWKQDGLNTNTPCGMPIVVRAREMTLGGVIRVVECGEVDGATSKKFYGMSAGHFIHSEEDSDSEWDDCDEGAEDLESNTSNEDDDPVYCAPTIRPALPMTVTPTSHSWNWAGSMQLGDVLEFEEADPVKPDLDWSLIQMLPNILGALQISDLVVAPKSTMLVGAPYRHVVVNSGTRGRQHGTLHFGPTRIMLGRSESFSNAYILKLGNGSVAEGDSGSWVVDPVTAEVLGHVVAKDMFGDAYVMPMPDVLQDIKSRIGCIEVGFPDFLDVMTEPAFMDLGIPTFLPSTPPVQSNVDSLFEVEAALPSTPPEQPYIDSGYATRAYCSPSMPIPKSSMPTTPRPSMEEIHASIRASLPQDMCAPDQGPAEGSLPNPRIFPCDQCNRAFDQPHKLNHHKRYHDRPHECPHAGCVMRFGTKTHLDRHINEKHNKPKRFYCTQPGCPYSRGGGKSFPRKDNWRRHIMNKHQITPDSDPGPEYVDDGNIATGA